jgi:hypothetical protein
MKSGTIIGACLVLALLLILPGVGADVNVELRMNSAIEWIAEQQLTSVPFPGFARGTDPSTNGTIYVKDQALVALALSEYRYTHNTVQYNAMIDTAANFTMSAQTPLGDFYEYYDVRDGHWHNYGDLYSWDAYAIGALALTSYRVTAEVQTPSNFWYGVEAKLKKSVSSFIGDQREDGAWLFRVEGTAGRKALTRENALMLAGLSYIGFFERLWGRPQQAAYYGFLAEKTAKWVFSMQVADLTQFNYGGFPHSDVNSTQFADENGEILRGIQGYYSAIASLVDNPSPTIQDTRRLMVYWVRGFVNQMSDSYGGLYYARTASAIVFQPQTTLGNAWVLRALVDIWVDLGDPAFRDGSGVVYDWMAGHNVAGADLQGAPNLAGGNGGFYRSINGSSVDTTSTMDVTAPALYAITDAAYIKIPEVPTTTTTSSATTSSKGESFLTTSGRTATTSASSSTTNGNSVNSLMYGAAVLVVVIVLVAVFLALRRRGRKETADANRNR